MASIAARAQVAAPEAELRISSSSGVTHSFKLPSQLREWKMLEADPAWQRGIRGMSVLHRGVQHVLPLPTAFRRVMHTLDVGLDRSGTPASIRVGYLADEISTGMTVYLGSNPPMVRFDVRRSGRLRWKAED